MKKADYKHGKFTIATTDASGIYEDCREDFKDFCEDFGIEPNDDKYWEWCHEQMQENWDCDMDNIKSCKEYDIPVLITGHLGLWWGKPEIEPVREESVYDAIQRCLSGADSVEVEWNDGKITVLASHHDGTNVFTINALSKKGVAKKDAPYKPHDVKRLPYLYSIGI